VKIRLYLDENAMDDRLVRPLHDQGVDVTTVREANLLRASDEQQLLYATQHGRVIYSYNVKDFMALHNKFLEQELPHAGIILAHEQRLSIGEQLRAILRLIDAKSAGEMHGQVVFLSAWK
jgi:predicted nuclease of predicted toxin-antitoxin system